MPITVIAHRGASSYAPENTFAAFDRAIAMKATEIEFDVRTTKDGYPVVLHDENVDWVTNGHGMIEDLRYEDIKDLDAGSWFGGAFKNERIPLLHETINKYADKCRMHIEVKSSDTAVAAEVASLIHKGGAGRSSVINTFWIDVARYVRRRQPDMSVALNLNELTPTTMTDAAGITLAGINLNYSLLTSDLVKQAHMGKLKLMCWGGDSPRFWRKAFLTGADGVFADSPDKAAFYLEYLARESEKSSSDALWKKK